MITMLRRLLLAVLATAASWPVLAHQASDAYLVLRGDETGIVLRVDVALRDLDLLVDLDADGDARLTWGEVRGAWPAIVDAVRAGVRLPGCTLQAEGGAALERRGDGVYAALRFRAPCRLGDATEIRYTLLRELDPTHRGILRIDAAGGDTALRVLDPTREDAASGEAATAGFVREGVRHIVTGYDHLLFLACLLLPAVMRRAPDGRGWRPVEGLRAALAPVAGIVTAFTLAHSITLGLAATGKVALPGALVEPAIAATIVVAALDNLRPVFGGRRSAAAFAFGLVHGFGFAGVLGELALPPGEFAWALLRFNLGLELGQLAIVAIAVALLYLLRRRPAYPLLAIRGGSAAAMALGVLWFVERTGLAP